VPKVLEVPKMPKVRRRITNYELRITKTQLRITNYENSITNYELRKQYFKYLELKTSVK